MKICNISKLLEKRNKYIILYSNSFKKQEQSQILIPQLNKLDFEARLYKVRQNHHIQYVIYIPRRNVDRFLNYIGPCPIKEFEYKWGRR